MPSRRLGFLLATLLGAALRLWFIVAHPVIQGDSLIYADIARNWLHRGIYGLTDGATVAPTLIRLPGYPAFLAAIFALFGDRNFVAVMLTQLAIDLLTCWAIATLAAELVRDPKREVVRFSAFALAVLCPFTANYVALPLTETLSIATAAWSLLFAVRSLRTAGIRDALCCGVLCALGCVLRPDNGIVVAAICLTLLFTRSRPVMPGLRAAVMIGFIAIVPLIPWTLRNWRTFHLFQPLAPRYANDPGEFVPHGFNRWVKTWIIDYVSTDEIYWHIDDADHPPDPDNLPSRAFDSPAQRDATYQLLYDIPSDGSVTPETDAQFAALARDRIRSHPLRYYLLLPAARIADMWLRPRTEMLDLGQRWWQFEDRRESWISIGWLLLNLAFVALAIAGCFGAERTAAFWVLIAFVAARSLFLGSLENPESRYTLECFPVVLALAGLGLADLRWRLNSGLTTQNSRPK